MKAKLFILGTLALVFTSCKTLKSGTSKSIDIVGTGVIHKPVIVDLEVNQTKISKTIILKGMESLEAAKSEIIRQLLLENDADLVVEPKFQSTTKNGKTELTLTGWLATYKNFRNLEEKDVRLLEVQPAINKNFETTQPIINLKK
jgi:hypothetical protein